MDHCRPSTVEQACHAVDGGAVPYRGGTVLFGAFEGHRPLPDRLVDLKGVVDLHGVALIDDEIRIGAASPLQDLAQNELLQATTPLLGPVCASVGNIRVRKSGSIGGNLCAGEGSSDVLTGLCALEAMVHLQTATDQRSVPIEDFFVEHRQVDLRSHELMTYISIPASSESAWAYRKVQLTGRPSVSVAVSRPRDRRGRIVVGALGPRPAIIEDRPRAVVDTTAIVADLPAVADHAAPASYKQHVAASIMTRALQDAQRREGM